MKKNLLLCSLACLLAACSTLPPVPPPGAAVQHCMVCRHQRDFDCLQVKPTAGTPQANHGGRTYYFCSGPCQKEFVGSPQRYAVKGR